jgi:hypothetical protein
MLVYSAKMGHSSIKDEVSKIDDAKGEDIDTWSPILASQFWTIAL